MRGKHNKLGEGERKVRLGQDSLPNKPFPLRKLYVVLHGPAFQLNVEISVQL